MTRDELRRRISALEEHATLQRGATETMHLFFVDRHGCKQNVNIAFGPENFICYRRPDETLEDFVARADAEVLAAKFRVPIAGLIFRRDEADVA
jgi:hypothetical protein